MRFAASLLSTLPLCLLACSGGSNAASTPDASTPDASAISHGDSGPPDDAGKITSPDDAGTDATADAAPACGAVGTPCCPGSTCNGTLSCTTGTCQTIPTPVSLDVINASLDGLSPFAAVRAPYVSKDIAARTSDVVCVLGVASAADRANISSAAMSPKADGGAGQFPYFSVLTTDASTPPSNPSDVVSAPASPPCSAGAGVDTTQVSDVYTCIEQNCSTTSGGDPTGAGTLNGSPACLSTSCSAPLSALYAPITSSSTLQQIANDACFDCMLYHLTSGETIATGQTACSSQAAAPFAYGGQTPVMLLSRFPLKNTTSYNLAATGFRRGILKAQVELANDQVVDVFCGDLTSPLLDTELPYTGSYGSDVAADGGTGNGWEAEQDHQAKEAVAWIQQQITADKVPAIVAMDLHADDGASTDGGISALSPEVFDLFASGFTPALPMSSAISCDDCSAPQNPYNAGTPSYEVLHTFLSGFPAGATESETLWGTDNGEVSIPSGLPGQPAPPGGTGPLLEYYAHNVTILVP